MFCVKLCLKIDPPQDQGHALPFNSYPSSLNKKMTENQFTIADALDQSTHSDNTWHLIMWQFDWRFDIIRQISLDLDWSGQIWGVLDRSREILTDPGRPQPIWADIDRYGQIILVLTFQHCWHLTFLTKKYILWDICEDLYILVKH